MKVTNIEIEINFFGYREVNSDFGCGSGFLAAKSNAAAGNPLSPMSWFNGHLVFVDNQNNL